MATVANQFDDSDTSQKSTGSNTTSFAAPTVGGPQGGGTTAVGAPAGGSATVTSAAPTASANTSSGRFNNLQKYVNANQDFNSQQGGLAGEMVSNINNQAQGVQNNIQGASNAFNTANQQAVNSFTNPNLVAQAISNPNAFVNGVQASGTQGQAGYQAAQDPGNMTAFNNIVNANYNGPKSLQDLSGQQNLSNLQMQNSNLNDTVNQTQSEAGRFNLLKTMFGNNNYNQGQQNLDNLLIQNNPAQLQQLQGVRQAANNTTQALTSANNNAQQAAMAAQNQAQATQNDVRGQLNNAVSTDYTNLQNQATAANTQQQTDLNSLYQAAASGTMTPAQMAMLGPNASQVANELQGLSQYAGIGGQFQNDLVAPLTASGDLAAGKLPSQQNTDYLNQTIAGINDQLKSNPINLTGSSGLFTTAAPATAQTIAGANDYANFAALNQLMGGTGNTPGSVASADNSALLAQMLPNASQAGTYAANQDVSLNNQTLQQMLSAAQGATQNIYNAASSRGGYTGAPAFNNSLEGFVNSGNGYSSETSGPAAQFNGYLQNILKLLGGSSGGLATIGNGGVPNTVSTSPTDESASRS